MAVSPGDEVHYVALMDQNLNTIHVMPMQKALDVPIDADPDWISVDVSLRVTMNGKATV